MILRDAHTVSLWQDYAGGYNVINRADPQQTYDVIIAGGGITGITTAFLLQNAGKNCLLIEAANLGYGTTGGTTAHLNTLVDVPYNTIQQHFGKEGARQVKEATAEAIQLIQHHIDRFDIRCGFEYADAYLFAQTEKEEAALKDTAEAMLLAGLDVSGAATIPVPFSFRKAVKVTGQAKFSPLPYIQRMAAAFEHIGGTILQQCRVTAVQDNDPMLIVTTLGAFRCRQFVYATHIPPGVNLLHLRCVPYRSYVLAATLADNNYPEDLSYDMQQPFHYYRTQVMDGQPYLIAGGEDHKTGHQENTEACFRKLEAHLREAFNIEDIRYRWSAQYYEPADGLPYIGRLPGQTGEIYVATGFGGNGMVYGTAAALLLKRLMLGLHSEYVKLFDPSRIKPIAGFNTFVPHNADVIKQLASRLLPAEKLEQLAGLAPGEGKLVSYEGSKIALYKDEQGALHAVDPICTHLGCEVHWNQAEKSWDCPCHGARYGIDGQVLNAPTSRNLDPHDIG
ncbi:FAD-dependent oxidoreductase [Chitinophaga varians]|uniref:FAD-dependent oxidoreductase n=1 Tax=Chitinophaga varians TaxID=2202339 RepID=A0A847S128_9BACT|nr:FAD-dependent oxidoreductase [Chitinophaga varians]NLR66577.1 FAD-dependent oxidoreductase [Chitinophaga varians]